MEDQTEPKRRSRLLGAVITELEGLSARWGFLPFVLPIFAIVIGSGLLGFSFWLDELLSVWVISDGGGEVIARAFEFQGQSPLYFLLLSGWAQIPNLFGLTAGEAWMRGLSLLLLILSASLLYQLARHLVNREFASIVIILFISIDTVIWSLSVRPYSLALFCSLASLWSLYQAAVTRKLGYWILYSVASIGVIYSHYLFAGVFLVQLALLVILRAERGIAKLPVLPLLGSGVFIAVALAPLAGQIAALAARSGGLLMQALPTFSDLALTILPGYLLVYIAFPIVFVLVVWRGSILRVPNRPVLYFAIAWQLVAVLILYCLSLYVGGSLMLPRYLSWGAPAAALLGASLIYGVRPFGARVVAVVVLILFILIREGGRVWKPEEWREASVVLNSLLERAHQSSSVLLYSGLIESEDLGFINDSRNKDYLRAPLQSYSNLPNDLVVEILPSHLEGPERASYRRKIEEHLGKYSQVIAVILVRDVGRTGRNTSWYYSQLLANLGFQVTTIPGTERVVVVRGKRKEQADGNG